jgi:protein-disulfide isomerase
VTEEGHPWIGAAEPVLEILEYSDYQCPHCRRGHDEMRQLIAANAETIRLVHRQFPLDHHCNMALSRPFHPQACRYAMLSYCAQQQGRFWEANDFLFAQGRRKQPVTSGELAAGINIDLAALESCMSSNDAKLAIQHDLEAGRALQIRGTPTFVVNGVTYPGRVPRDVIDAALGGSARPRPARRR